jgi:D-amino peptidase
MKKIFISADFEGAAGIVDPRQCSAGHPWFEQGRRLWTADINAAVEGALNGGAQEVLVNEAHAEMNYLDLDCLHPKAGLVSGYVKVDNQMEGIDSSFSGAFLLGHAQAGAIQAVLAHTYVMRDIVEIRLNGNSIGEFGLSTLWAAYYAVPVILAVGDDRYCQEAREVVPEIETAIVKYGLAQFSARHLPAGEARQIIQAAAARAVTRLDQIQPVTLPDHFRMEIQFVVPQAADLCSFVPTIERVDGRTVAFESDDYRTLQQTRIVCTNLALAVARSHFNPS